MIRGIHGLFYSSQAQATRKFMRDKLRLPFTDVGGGWLIFDLPEGDVGVHPLEQGAPPTGKHDISFYCDDIKGTMAELAKRGVQFKHDPVDHGYGYVTYFKMPGGVEVQLYEPKYQKRARKPNGVGRAATRSAKRSGAKRSAAKRSRAKRRTGATPSAAKRR